MATTTWHTLTRFAPRQWLLADGTIISEPTLEQTSSGRKVRIQGRLDSTFYTQLDVLLTQNAFEQAEALGTKVLTEVTDYEATLHENMGFNPMEDEKRAQLHILHPERSDTVAWWRFELPSTPLHVYLVARLDTAIQWNRPGGMAVTFTLWMPRLPLPGNGSPLIFDSVTHESFPPFQDATRYNGMDTWEVWRKFLQEGAPHSWDSKFLAHWEVHPSPRQAVNKYLKIIRSIESEQTIQIPDASSLDNPRWLTLELTDTNVNNEFINDAVEYLDTDAAAERLLSLYSQMRDELRALGIEAGEKTHDDFTTAVMSGDKGKFNMQVTNPAAEAGYPDQEHTLSVHLPSGTFVVECNHREPRGDVLERWEEAKTIAALGGEEDELLAFARAMAKKKHKKRTKTIIAERKGSDDV